MEQPSLFRSPLLWPALPGRGTKLYDLLMGSPLILFYTIGGWGRAQKLGLKFSNLDLSRLTFDKTISIISDINVLAVALLFVLYVTFRSPPIARAPGVMPRIAALCGTYLVVLLVLITPPTASGWVLSVSTVMVLVGSLFAAYAVLHLGRSVSLMAEARKLVTSGPYRIVRHPLYLGEAIAVAGCVLQCLSLLALLVFALQVAFQFYRMSREEEVLSATFPEYHDYARQTWQILPGLY